jgi:hypothetical protein
MQPAESCFQNLTATIDYQNGKIFFLDWDKSQNTKYKMMTSIDGFNRIRQITGGIVLFLAIHNFKHRLI